MLKKPLLSIFLPVFLPSIIMSGCGGGGGGGGTDTVSSEITSRGVITGFGSVFVNGVRFHTNSTSFTLDDSPGSESDLSLGMVVTVTGTINDDSTGNASSIVFDNEVQGPVSNLTVGLDNNSKTFTVLGVTVTVDRVATSFNDSDFDSLANGDVVEVSGFFDGSLVLNATFLEKKNNFVLDISEVELKGNVSNATTDSFSINGITINYDSSGITTDLSRLPGGISDGIFVEVKGTMSSADTVTATRIHREDAGFNDNINKVSIEGIITDYVDDSNFSVSGVQIDASSALFSPTTLVLGNGVKVEAEGPLVDGTIQAIKVESRGGNSVKLEATVSAISASEESITLNLINGSVKVFRNSQTKMEDATKAVASLSIDNLGTGDFLEVRGMLDGSGDIVATEIKRNDLDDIILQGPVTSFVANSSITILGVTYLTSTGTQFEDINDQVISGTQFFNTLTTGMLVKVKDSEPGDGTADEVEFEN
ncbi:MAG: hypothetical protein KZQ96_17085 [Candidatus Thiodiazotropha sp. (ex Lucinoma borealis)]|nr:hypothetical protein [Candidatus Thiodiazotropha sp. (ex Lucinoma borealis)]MCU7868566.1 hypothetical protein [Candidatus Thiodiazotropha sp. (ex Lucinoma borealis)]